MPPGWPPGRYPNQVPSVDLVMEYRDQDLLLIERAKPPLGWALPGGFGDYGESLEAAARRETLEETGLEVSLLGQLHTYSHPWSDPRQHAITNVFVARGSGIPRAADDARRLAIFSPETLPASRAFNHTQILTDYLKVPQDWLVEKVEKSC